MMLALKIAGVGLGIYGGLCLIKLGGAWMKRGIDEMMPPSKKDKEE